MAGRPSALRNQEFCIAVAEAYVGGLGKEDMAELLGCNKDTIRVWVKDPRVQVHIVRLTRERIARITRKIDSEMEARMASVKNWKTEDLLKVRKEYLDRTRTSDSEMPSGGAASDTVSEISDAMDQNPDLAEALRALVEG